MLLAYTRLYERRSARALAIQRMPWGDVPGWPEHRNARWHRLREHAVRLVAGEIPDPCPRAMHWRSPVHDILPDNMVPVWCPGTINQMLAMRGVKE